MGWQKKREGERHFSSGAVVKNPLAKAGDMGLSPGLGRSHMPRSHKARAPQLLSLRSRAHEPQIVKPAGLEPMLCNKRSHDNEKPAHHNEEQPPLPQLEKACMQQQRPNADKNKFKKEKEIEK